MIYTIDNPKQVNYFSELYNFTGAAQNKNGEIICYVNGKFHREDGPAVIWANGTIEYWLNGKLHRKDGPAIIFTSNRVEYYLNGKCHREDGPAVIRSDGTVEYWLNHKKLNISTDLELKDCLLLLMFE